MTEDVVVIGAGAAGTMAAIFAAQNGARVLLLERTRDGGRKILISGGGRCNVLPSELHPSQYFTSSSRNSLKKILLSWPLSDQRRFIESELGVPLALETESGKLFPASNKARDVRDALVEQAKDHGVRLQHSVYVTALEPAQSGWQVHFEDGRTLAAGRVILATGGLSVPATGSDGTGLVIAQRLGHTVQQMFPALTPLTCVPPRHAELAGVSLDVTLKSGDFLTRGGFLFTHRGYSGPAVLNISHLAVQSRMAGQERAKILVQWTPLTSSQWDALLRSPAGTVGSVIRREVPARLGEALIREAGADPETPLAQLKKDVRLRLVRCLTEYELPWTGDEGYKKAEVTGGGVALAEVDPRTLESRLHKGLFLCGEILDAFGPIGGYNFAWGWATGRLAGLGAAGA